MTRATSDGGLLVSARFLRRHGDELERAETEARLRLERIELPDDPDARLSSADCARVELAFFSPDVFPELSRSFVSAVYRSPSLRWLQVFNAGIDHRFFRDVMERGVRLSTAAGTSAEPIAHTAIAALLWLARGFPHWLDAQRRRAWETLPRERVPRDLSGQVLLVVGLGGIGGEVARLGKALGLYAIGVRRSPPRPDDPVDELHTPARLPELLPRADWLVLACPLTEETRGLVDAEALARLPRGAHVLNVGRGGVVDEAALAEALRKGHLAGAYLDVFEIEPLPAASPLWSLPNVLLTPHNSAASRGNERRQLDRFLENLVRWGHGEPLLGEQ